MLPQVTFLLIFPALALAHFQLQFPPPRGPFVASNEPNYCDGYVSTTDNRTNFPLDGGFYSLHSGHPSWTFGVQIANTQNPTSFDNFTTTVPFFPNTGAGNFCFPVNLKTSSGSNLVNGANVTLQFVYDGGDGALYQCADVTLVSGLKIDSSVQCVNQTTPSSSSSSAPGPTQSSGAMDAMMSSLVAAMAGLAVMACMYM
ncbi:hypothetical protein BDW22DRAFT_1355118 [Trametopsis cervina]|nr:hypothetical protein BDW22DRAFT_1355118 [Trametopsis cervina]